MTVVLKIGTCNTNDNDNDNDNHINSCHKCTVSSWVFATQLINKQLATQYSTQPPNHEDRILPLYCITVIPQVHELCCPVIASAKETARTWIFSSILYYYDKYQRQKATWDISMSCDRAVAKEVKGFHRIYSIIWIPTIRGRIPSVNKEYPTRVEFS